MRYEEAEKNLFPHDFYIEIMAFLAVLLVTATIASKTVFSSFDLKLCSHQGL
jgi:hypothetical protein